MRGDGGRVMSEPQSRLEARSRPELHQLRDAVGILLNRAFRPAILQTQILSLDITELMEPLP